MEASDIKPQREALIGILGLPDGEGVHGVIIAHHAKLAGRVVHLRQIALQILAG